jgi:hypothetical protein
MIINRIYLKASMVMLLLFAAGCTQDDALTPVNEVEFITTVNIVFTPTSGGKKVTLEFKDLDGEGANEPIVTISSAFEKATTYNGIVSFRNDLANPAIDITPEIIEEALEHQMFYQTTGNLNPILYATTKSNLDSKGMPLGLQSVFTTTTAASGTLRVSLRHGPNKNGQGVSSGDITNAGGATDAAVDFPIKVE